MKRFHALILAGVMVVATAATAAAAEYDRYERGGRDRGEYATPPPRRGADVAPPRHAQFGEPYFFGHLGTFSPNDDSDGLRGYDSGGHIEFGVGSRVSPIFSVDGSIGAYGADRGSNETRVVPMTIGGRFIIPHPFIEPYAGAGLGLYFSKLKENPVGSTFSGIDDTSTDVGGYLSLGLDMWLNNRVALNFEGKYHFLQPTFQTNLGTDFDVNLGGWTANLGVRVAF
jgi:hypothetical protein